MAALRANKAIIGLLASLIGLSLMLLWLYPKLIAYATIKTEPYSLRFDISNSAQETSIITLSYDYGYGINKNHSRIIKLKNNTGEHTIELSLSAWKKIRELTFSGQNNDDYQLNRLSIVQANTAQQFEKNQLIPVKQGNKRLYQLAIALKPSPDTGL